MPRLANHTLRCVSVHVRYAVLVVGRRCGAAELRLSAASRRVVVSVSAGFAAVVAGAAGACRARGPGVRIVHCINHLQRYRAHP